jgi:hypothetical protein
MLVVDASVALDTCAVEDGFGDLRDADLVSLPLRW